MSLLFFLIFNIALLLLNASVILAASIGEVIHIPVVGLVGVFTALIGIHLARKNLKAKGFGLLATTMSSVIVLTNYGLFALILTRNPMLQWPAVFLMTSIAALLLGGLGYRRATVKLHQEP